MKKFVTILLALAMILALTIPAFAETTTNLTITGENKTYNGYKLLNLSTGLKPSHTTHDGDCTDTCYNYSYTVNEKYEDILKEVLEVNNDDAILAKLATLTSDNGVADYGTLRPVADAIYRAIKKANLAPDANQGRVFNGTANIEQGYWLFADVTNLDTNANDANSLVMVDTKGLNDLTITPKTGLPTVEKKVEDDEAAGWQDSADYDIGDNVPFQLTATLPANLAGYKEYAITFHDTMSAALTLDADSFKVYADGTELTTGYTVKTTGLLDTTCTFEVLIPNVLEVSSEEGTVTVTKDTKFVVEYTAELNNAAVIGAAGNPNEVYLEYSNNPYGTGPGKTAKDKVTVFTYKLVINKVDGSNNNAPLTGAEFTLSKKTGENTYTEISKITSTEEAPLSTFIWTGLDAGEYKLEENNPPAGYNKLTEAIVFTITADHEADAADPQLTSLISDGLGTADATTGTITDTIQNFTGTVLPETGAKGTMWLIGGGALLVAFASVFMITRKKMSVFED